jgi:hypothetical protein
MVWSCAASAVRLLVGSVHALTEASSLQGRRPWVIMLAGRDADRTPRSQLERDHLERNRVRDAEALPHALRTGTEKLARVVIPVEVGEVQLVAEQ